MNNSIVRQATFLDITGMVRLAERLWDYEESLGCSGFDKNEKKNIMQLMSKSLVNPDNLVLVIERNNLLRGLFICEVINQSAVQKHKKACNVWMGITNKGGVYIKRLLAIGNKWAADRGCTVIKITCLPQNERVQRLIEKVGGTKVAVTYDIPIKPMHDDLEKAAVTGIDSLYLQALAPELKPVVKMTRGEYLFAVEHGLIAEWQNHHSINGTVYIIHPCAGKLETVRDILDSGNDSELLGYPNKGKDHIAVTKQGEIILEYMQMAKEAARHNLIWSACGRQNELIKKANAISEVMRRAHYGNG